MKVDCNNCGNEFDDEERDAETCSPECEAKWVAFKAEAAAHGMPPLLYAGVKIMERAAELGITARDIDRKMAASDWLGLGGPPERN